MVLNQALQGGSADKVIVEGFKLRSVDVIFPPCVAACGLMIRFMMFMFAFGGNSL